MKKILAILLTAAMVSSITACGSQTGNGDTTGTSTVSSSSTAASSGPESGTAAPSGTESGTKAPESTGGSESAGIEGYPASLDDWTGQQFVDYFKSAGVFNDGNGEETWVQDHSYWGGTPVNECAGFWDDLGMKMVMIFIIKSDLPDSSEEEYNEWKTMFKEKKVLQITQEDPAFPIDHLVGNVALNYSESLDEEFAEKMDKAWTDLVAAMGATADF